MIVPTDLKGQGGRGPRFRICFTYQVSRLRAKVYDLWAARLTLRETRALGRAVVVFHVILCWGAGFMPSFISVQRQVDTGSTSSKHSLAERPTLFERPVQCYFPAALGFIGIVWFGSKSEDKTDQTYLLASFSWPPMWAFIYFLLKMKISPQSKSKAIINLIILGFESFLRALNSKSKWTHWRARSNPGSCLLEEVVAHPWKRWGPQF